MMRRLFLFGWADGRKPERIPAEEHLLNHFADAYNAYIARLREGLIDMRLWGRVLNAWKKLVGE